AGEPRQRHLPDPDQHPGLFLVGDYLFDSTINGVYDSADFVTDMILTRLRKQKYGGPQTATPAAAAPADGNGHAGGNGRAAPGGAQAARGPPPGTDQPPDYHGRGPHHGAPPGDFCGKDTR